MSIKSLTQHVLEKKTIVFEGDVEVLIDQKIHLWADRVDVDKEKQTIKAQCIKKGSVVLETSDFLILADSFFLDILHKVGHAENICIHIDEGYLSAAKAEKRSDNTWHMEKLVYTPCDAPKSHWHFSAQKAVVHGNYFVRASNLLFKIGDFPIFVLPRMIFPIQGHSKSGFLIPKFYFDYDQGLGIKQEYYWHIHKHCDTTIGVDWRRKKGVVFSDEFRWARSKESFSLINSQYANAKNMFVQKEGKIYEASKHRYWVQGKDFQTLGNIGNAACYSLACVDFGTDKRIGYNFFNTVDEIDNTFYNAGVIRSLWPNNQGECRIDSLETGRKRFLALMPREKIALDALVNSQRKKIEDRNGLIISKKEIEDNVTVIHFPHFEWNSGYLLGNKYLSYRHDFFIDQAFFRQKETERIYANSLLFSESNVIPQRKADVLRLGYQGSLSSSMHFLDQAFKFKINPALQFRSNKLQDSPCSRNVIEHTALGNGAYRLFCKYGAEWAMPEGEVYNTSGSYQHLIQPIIQWEWLPKFYQSNWHYMDRWDRAYPKNELALLLRNNIILRDLTIDVNVSQGLDFYHQKDLFCLRRGVGSHPMLPFRYDFNIDSGIFSLGVAQEFEWDRVRLLQSEVYLGMNFNKVQASIGYLFQDNELQHRRELLSRVPHFLLLGLAVPVSKHATVLYDGQFYAEKNKHLLSIDGVKPLLHRIRLDYEGHCWGFYIGLEEKYYREYGNQRREHAIVFSLRLESLGSFAKKFKRPPMYKEKE